MYKNIYLYLLIILIIILIILNIKKTNNNEDEIIIKNKKNNKILYYTDFDEKNCFNCDYETDTMKCNYYEENGDTTIEKHCE